MPFFDTCAEFGVANGLLDRMTSGSLATFVIAVLTTSALSEIVPLLAWNTIWPAYPPCCGKVLSRRHSPVDDWLPVTV